MEDMSLDELLGALQSAQEAKPKVCLWMVGQLCLDVCTHFTSQLVPIAPLSLAHLLVSVEGLQISQPAATLADIQASCAQRVSGCLLSRCVFRSATWWSSSPSSKLRAYWEGTCCTPSTAANT